MSEGDTNRIRLPYRQIQAMAELKVQTEIQFQTEITFHI